MPQLAQAQVVEDQLSLHQLDGPCRVHALRAAGYVEEETSADPVELVKAEA